MASHSGSERRRRSAAGVDLRCPMACAGHRSTGEGLLRLVEARAPSLFPPAGLVRPMTMKHLADVDSGSLRWSRAGAGHSYELLAGSDVLATLRWRKALGSLAVAETAEGTMSLKRAGFLSPYVSVQEPSGKVLASLHVHWNASSLHVASGELYRWMRLGYWVPAWRFDDRSGNELVNFEPVRRENRLEGALVVVSERGRAVPDLLLLLVLGWYFIVLSWIEDEAVAASGAVLRATTEV
jgi:hypothetical protein